MTTSDRACVACVVLLLAGCRCAPSESPNPADALAPSAAPRPLASATASALPSEGAAPPAEPAQVTCPDTMTTIGALCIDTHEVTTADYLACVASAHCAPPGVTNERPGITQAERTLLDPLCNAREPLERATHPINCVDFAAASAFCRAQGARLPSAGEWERAACGPRRSRYPWGESAPVSRLLNACGEECVAWKKEHEDLLAKPPLAELRPRAEAYPGDDGFVGTAPVGSFHAGASPEGIEDLAGNVAEWVDDHTVRGGSWLSTKDDSVRAVARRVEAGPESTTSATIGFRCAKPL